MLANNDGQATKQSSQNHEARNARANGQTAIKHRYTLAYDSPGRKRPVSK